MRRRNVLITRPYIYVLCTSSYCKLRSRYEAADHKSNQQRALRVSEAGKLGCASSKPELVKDNQTTSQQSALATAAEAAGHKTTDPAASPLVGGGLAAGDNGGAACQPEDDSVRQQLQRLQPLLQANLEQQQLQQQQLLQLQQQQQQLQALQLHQQQQQQRQQQQVQQQQQHIQQQQAVEPGGLGGVPDFTGPGPGQYPLSGYSCSVQSYDDLNATDSAASTPRSRSSYAASNQHQPPSRGASGSGAADFRSGKLRRPPRARSSGSGLRSTLLEDHNQLSFTDSITNTTNSSEASPRRSQWQPGSRSNSQQLQDVVDTSSMHGNDAYLRSRSSQLDDTSSHLPHISSESLLQQQQQPPHQQQQQPHLPHSSSFDCAASAASLDAGNVLGGASTYGGSSIGGLAPRSASMTAAGRRGSCDPSSSGQQMSLLQLQRAIENIMVSDVEMYAKLQAGLKGIHSLARETNRLTVARDVTGATCINQYVVVKTLGRGSYGKVKLCLNTFDGQLYAIKMMNRSCLLRTLQRPRAGLRKSGRRSVSANNAAEASQQHNTANAVAAAAAAGLTSGGLCSDEANEVNREIAILKKLDHPNVVKLFEVIDPPGSQYMMLVMEFMEKGPVLQTHNQSGFGSLPEEVAADFFRQAVLGLEYLHFHKVVHGDIKPENLLVSSNGELKISDFGCSRMADGQSSQAKLTGTPAFTAPELVSGNAADPFAADVWALGACLFCFIYGRLPFQGGCVLDVFQAIATQPLSLPDDVTISPHLADLFFRMFDKDPRTRITLQEIMCDPWVTDEGRAPLRSCADLGLGSIEVTTQEQAVAIDRDSVVSMIRARLKEKVFRSNEYLFQAGQPMNCVYFVMSGAVEILRSATQEDAEREFSGNTSIEHSFTVDLDESLMLDCSVVGDLPIGAVNGRLHIDRLKARDLKHRHRGHLMEHMEVVVDVKGPGQVVGEVFMQDAPPPCHYSARARGDVLALKLTQQNYMQALAAMMYEAEHGARATAHSAGASRGRPPPSASASSPGMLGVQAQGSTAAAAAVAAAAAGSSGFPPGGQGFPMSSSSDRPGGLQTPASAFHSQPPLSPTTAAAAAAAATAAAAAAAGGDAAAAARLGASAASMHSSTGGSYKDLGAPLSSSTPVDSSTAQLSVLGVATNTSSSGSLVMRGPHAGSQRPSGHLSSGQGVAGSIADDSGPLKLIGSGDGTDDEGHEQRQHMPSRLSVTSAAAPAAAAAGVAGGAAAGGS